MSRPALRHGNLNSPFQVALYLLFGGRFEQGTDPETFALQMELALNPQPSTLNSKPYPKP